MRKIYTTLIVAAVAITSLLFLPSSALADTTDFTLDSTGANAYGASNAYPFTAHVTVPEDLPIGSEIRITFWYMSSTAAVFGTDTDRDCTAGIVWPSSASTCVTRWRNTGDRGQLVLTTTTAYSANDIIDVTFPANTITIPSEAFPGTNPAVNIELQVTNSDSGSTFDGIGDWDPLVAGNSDNSGSGGTDTASDASGIAELATTGFSPIFPIAVAGMLLLVGLFMIRFRTRSKNQE